MIAQEIMDSIIHVPEEGEYMEELAAKLEAEGFVVTNMSKGGVLYTILYVVAHGVVELKKLAVDLVNAAFMQHCPEELVEVRAADYACQRKQGTCTRGNMTIYRTDYSTDVVVRKGHPFATDPDAGGAYLTFYAGEDTVLPAGAAVCTVPVVAQKKGSACNVPPGSITRTLVLISGCDRVCNEDGWVTSYGTDGETVEELRRRCIESRSIQSLRTINEKLKSVAEAVDGVASCRIDDDKPRGQGTVDVIIASGSGPVSEETVRKVQAAVDPYTGSYGNILVRAVQTNTINVDLECYIDADVAKEGIAEQVKAGIEGLIRDASKKGWGMIYTDDIHHRAMTACGGSCRRCTVHTPAGDIAIDKNTMCIPGTVNVAIHNLG